MERIQKGAMASTYLTLTPRNNYFKNTATRLCCVVGPFSRIRNKRPECFELQLLPCRVLSGNNTLIWWDKLGRYPCCIVYANYFENTTSACLQCTTLCLSRLATAFAGSIQQELPYAIHNGQVTVPIQSRPPAFPASASWSAPRTSSRSCIEPSSTSLSCA